VSKKTKHRGLGNFPKTTARNPRQLGRELLAVEVYKVWLKMLTLAAAANK